MRDFKKNEIVYVCDSYGEPGDPRDSTNLKRAIFVRMLDKGTYPYVCEIEDIQKVSCRTECFRWCFHVLEKSEKSIPTKPPIGLKPKYIHNQERFVEVASAIQRYAKANKAVCSEWIEELDELNACMIDNESNLIKE